MCEAFVHINDYGYITMIKCNNCYQWHVFYNSNNNVINIMFCRNRKCTL